MEQLGRRNVRQRTRRHEIDSLSTQAAWTVVRFGIVRGLLHNSPIFFRFKTCRISVCRKGVLVRTNYSHESNLKKAESAAAVSRFFWVTPPESENRCRCSMRAGGAVSAEKM